MSPSNKYDRKKSDGSCGNPTPRIHAIRIPIRLYMIFGGQGSIDLSRQTHRFLQHMGQFDHIKQCALSMDESTLYA